MKGGFYNKHQVQIYEVGFDTTAALIYTRAAESSGVQNRNAAPWMYFNGLRLELRVIPLWKAARLGDASQQEKTWTSIGINKVCSHGLL